MAYKRRLLFSPDDWQLMLTRSEQGAPEEVCGLAVGIEDRITKVFPITNSLHSPVRFEMDPEEQLKSFLWMEDQGLELLAIYHSHPHGPSVPSETDLAEFAYPGTIYIICAPGEEGWYLYGYEIQEGFIQPVSLEVEQLRDHLR